MLQTRRPHPLVTALAASTMLVACGAPTATVLRSPEGPLKSPVDQPPTTKRPAALQFDVNADAWSSSIPQIDFSVQPFSETIGNLGKAMIKAQFDGASMCVVVEGPGESGGRTCATSESSVGFVDISTDSGDPDSDRAIAILAMSKAQVGLATIDELGNTTPCNAMSESVTGEVSVVGCTYSSKNVVGLRFSGLQANGEDKSVSVAAMNPSVG